MVCKFSEKQKPRHFSADGGRNFAIISRMSAAGPKQKFQIDALDRVGANWTSPYHSTILSLP